MKKKLIFGVLLAVLIFGGAVAVGAANLGLSVVNTGSIEDDNINKVDVKNSLGKQENLAKETTTVAKEKIISREEAIAIAEKEVNGKVYSFELDRDDGRLEYEIELLTDKYEVEIEMDARNGKILEKDYDDLEDDDFYDDDRYDNDDRYDD